MKRSKSKVSHPTFRSPGCIYYDKQGRPMVTARQGTEERIKQLLAWAKLLEDNNYRRVAYTKLPWGGCVGTVFLGIDQSMGMSPQPIVFRTSVFDGDLETTATKMYSQGPNIVIKNPRDFPDMIYEVDSSTLKDAKAAHLRVVNMFKKRKD